MTLKTKPEEWGAYGYRVDQFGDIDELRIVKVGKPFEIWYLVPMGNGDVREARGVFVSESHRWYPTREAAEEDRLWRTKRDVERATEALRIAKKALDVQRRRRPPDYFHPSKTEGAT